jgi:hypothetical protein
MIKIQKLPKAEIQEKTWALAFITSAVLLCFACVSCAADTSTAPISPGETTRGTVEPSVIENILSATTFAETRGSHVSVSGTAALPDGTKLRSQLWKSSQPIQWWPKDKDIEVVDGQWEILVPFDINGVPDELAYPYTFEVWIKDSPHIKDVSVFGFMP